VVSGVDVVLDPRGGADFRSLAGVLRAGGIIVTLKGQQAGYEQRLAELGVRAAYVYVGPDRTALRNIAERLAGSTLRVFVERILPLEQAAIAHTIGERGHVRGKIVLDVHEQ
jgi:NADPH:quinone reductase-like Zn-dependent oxidoreductase